MLDKCYAHQSIAELIHNDADVVITRVEHGAYINLANIIDAAPDVLLSRPLRRKAKDTTESAVDAASGAADRLECGTLRAHHKAHGASGTYMYSATAT